MLELDSSNGFEPLPSLCPAGPTLTFLEGPRLRLAYAQGQLVIVI